MLENAMQRRKKALRSLHNEISLYLDDLLLIVRTRQLDSNQLERISRDIERIQDAQELFNQNARISFSWNLRQRN